MKIRVTTEGKSVMVDMEPKLADKVFKALVLQLLQAGGIENSFLRHTLYSQWKSHLNPRQDQKRIVKNWMGCTSTKVFSIRYVRNAETSEDFAARKRLKGFTVLSAGQTSHLRKNYCPYM